MGVEYPRGVDLNTACQFITRVELNDERLKREFVCKKEGDTVVIRTAVCDVFGGCACRFVLAGLIEPRDNLCRLCQAGYYEDYFEYLTGRRPIKIEIPESRTMGHRLCVARCHFEPMK